jgi:hypothetical protein
MVALESALIEDPDYTVAKGGDPEPYEKRGLLVMEEGIVSGRGVNDPVQVLDVWFDPCGYLAGVSYTISEVTREMLPGSACVVPVKATYTIEEW